MKLYWARDNALWGIPPLDWAASTKYFHFSGKRTELQEILKRTTVATELTGIINLTGTPPPYTQEDRQSSSLCSDLPLIRAQGARKILWSKSWHCFGFWRVIALVGKRCLKNPNLLTRNPNQSNQSDWAMGYSLMRLEEPTQKQQLFFFPLGATRLP